MPDESSGDHIMAEFANADALPISGSTGSPVETGPGYARRLTTIDRLLDAVERHAAAEADALDQYEHIATVSGDPVIALVMRLILEDEERHHGLLRRMESSLRDALYWTRSPESLPRNRTPQEPVAAELSELTRALIAEEHSGADHMRELARREESIDYGLDSMLLETMAMDSEKHARLLQFVYNRLAARARADESPSA
jgi:rubrerythrin